MKIGNQEIMFINALQSLSGITARDCFIHGDNVTFLVKENQMGAVIGKNGIVIKKLREKSKKRVEVFAFSEKPGDFLKKALKGINIGEIKINENDGRKELEGKIDSEGRRKLASMGRTMKRIKELMERNYKIKAIKLK